MLASMFCIRCGSQLVDGATFCHSCGAPCEVPPSPAGEYEWVAEARRARQQGSVRPQTEVAPRQPMRPRSGSQVVKLVLQGLLGMIAVVWLFNKACGGPSEAPPDSGTTNGSMAMVQCEDYVKEYLKAPSTAEFSGIAETQVIVQGNGKYAVIGWVDSQNSFGAKLRTKYVCKTTDDGNGHWSFEPLVVNDGSE